MKALQRLVITGHWVVFLYTAVCWGSMFYRLATDESFTLDSFIDGLFFDEALLHLFLWGGLVGFASVLWVFTGKFILWPWNRSLPKEED